MRYSGIIFISFVSMLIITGCCEPQHHPQKSINIEISEDGFTPKKWEVTSGEFITLTITNKSSSSKEWILSSKPVSFPNPVIDQSNLLENFRIESNNTETFTFQAPAAPGEYEFLIVGKKPIDSNSIGLLLVIQSGY